jgi:hypothetical protein
VSVALGFFAVEAGQLVPQPVARGLWGTDQMHGLAISGALGRAIEQAIGERGRTELRAARYNVDLFKPAAMALCTTTTEIVREGPRLCLVGATLRQEGVPVARASALFLRPSESPGGAVWSSGIEVSPPPDLPAASDERLPLVIGSDDTGWTGSLAGSQNGSRKFAWQTALPVIVGEEPSPFVSVASVADAASMVTNLGSNGVEFINADISLAISRLPVSREIGMVALERSEHDGIASGTALVYDREGAIGTSTVVAIANARRA